MTTNLQPDPAPQQTPLMRAQRLAERARAHEARGQLTAAEKCRRLAFALIQYAAIAQDETCTPTAAFLERLIAAHVATDAQRAA